MTVKVFVVVQTTPGQFRAVGAHLDRTTAMRATDANSSEGSYMVVEAPLQENTIFLVAALPAVRLAMHGFVPDVPFKSVFEPDHGQYRRVHPNGEEEIVDVRGCPTSSVIPITSDSTTGCIVYPDQVVHFSGSKVYPRLPSGKTSLNYLLHLLDQTWPPHPWCYHYTLPWEKV